MDDILDWSVEEIQKGCAYEKETDRYICNICRRAFENGEVYKDGERYFNAEKMAERHVTAAHGAMLDLLVSFDKRYTGLTDIQKTLLRLMSAGLSDQQIAVETGTTASTVRHQRFVFKEKAKQAKLYLAIYMLAVHDKRKARSIVASSEEFIDIHGGAKMVDERYQITKEEEETIVSNMFSSLEPLRLINLSPKEKKKIVILKKIAGQLDSDRKYTEKELNSILQAIYNDFATIRRYLIEYGFMDRTPDGKEYWLI